MESRSGDSTVVEHFDRLSRTGAWSRLYAEFDPLTYHFHVRRQRVLELLPEQLGDVLDVGCGPAVMTQAVLDRGGRFTGVDLAPEMVREATAQFDDDPRIHVQLGDIEHLEFPGASFDQVICMAVLEYLPDAARAVGEMARVLRPGGVAIITMPKRIHIDRVTLAATAPARFLARRIAHRESHSPPKLLLQPAELAATVERAGLNVDGVSQYQFTPIPYPFHRLAPRWALQVNLRGERWHATRSRTRSFLAHGFVLRARKPD